MTTKHFREFERLAGELGISDATVRGAGRCGHPKLYGRVGRRNIKVPVPSSPSDNRALVNVKASLRHAMRSAGVCPPHPENGGQ